VARTIEIRPWSTFVPSSRPWASWAVESQEWNPTCWVSSAAAARGGVTGLASDAATASTAAEDSMERYGVRMLATYTYGPLQV